MNRPDNHAPVGLPATFVTEPPPARLLAVAAAVVGLPELGYLSEFYEHAGFAGALATAVGSSNCTATTGKSTTTTPTP